MQLPEAKAGLLSPIKHSDSLDVALRPTGQLTSFSLVGFCMSVQSVHTPQVIDQVQEDRSVLGG